MNTNSLNLRHINETLKELGIGYFKCYTTYSSNQCAIEAEQNIMDRERFVTTVRHYFTAPDSHEGLEHLIERAKKAQGLLKGKEQ